MHARWVLAATLGMAACGGSGGSDGTGFTGQFVIEGTPHGGSYLQCQTTFTGNGGATMSCSGLGTCSQDPQTGCGLQVFLPATTGTFQCATGQTTVTLFDVGLPADDVGEHPAQAICNGHYTTDGTTSPECPTDASGCNQLIGDCTVSVGAIHTLDAQDPFGHFTGSISATVWTSDKPAACPDGSMGAWQGDGQMLSITASGGW